MFSGCPALVEIVTRLHKIPTFRTFAAVILLNSDKIVKEIEAWLSGSVGEIDRGKSPL